MEFAPIILFVYNRLWHTRKTVEALQKNELAIDSELFIFADGPKPNASDESKAKVDDVRQYIHTIKGFKNITIEESSENKGLANSVIEGVTKIINQFGKVIVVEDDIVTHPFFLRFMNEALDKYAVNRQIFMIGAYCYDVRIPFYYKKNIYLTPRYCSWGWATWQNRWQYADWNIDNYSLLKNYDNVKKAKEIEMFNQGSNDLFPLLLRQQRKEIDSWAIRWQYCMYLHNGYTLQPVFSLSYNIGFDGSGVHCPTSINSSTKHSSKKVPLKYNIKLPSYIKTNKRIIKNYKLTQDSGHMPTIKERILYFISKRLKKWNIQK